MTGKETFKGDTKPRLKMEDSKETPHDILVAEEAAQVKDYEGEGN